MSFNIIKMHHYRGRFNGDHGVFSGRNQFGLCARLRDALSEF